VKYRWSPQLWLPTIILVGAALRFFPIWFGLPYSGARPDEETAIGHSVSILRGDLNPRFFHWPSLTFYAFAGIFHLMTWVRALLPVERPLDYTDYLLVARAFVALCGTLTILVLFSLARRIAGKTTGLIAAFLLAVAILHVRDSHFAMTDVLTTLLVTASLTMLIAAVDKAFETAGGGIPLPPFALAGLVGGLATSTKYSAAAILAAMAGAQLVLVTRPSTRVLSLRTWAPSLIFGGMTIVGFVIATPYSILDFQTFVHDVRFTTTHLALGHGVDLGRGWFYHLRRSLPYGLGVPTFAAAIAGLIPFIRRYPRAALMIGAFAAAFYVSIGSGQTVFFRYVLPLVPVACLSAAMGIRHAAVWMASRLGSSERATFAVLFILVALPALVNCVWFDVLLARTDTRVIASRWLRERVEPGATLHDAGSSYSRLDLRNVNYHAWSFDAEKNSFGDPDGRTPDWLVFHASPLRLYSGVAWPLRRLADESYTLVWRIDATHGRPRDAVYDPQDAFFMPFYGFHIVERPGPSIEIYKRRDLSR
jgi:4-amino-4-deoxy-L-arabinose transferase-like glycosyltransferase